MGIRNDGPGTVNISGKAIGPKDGPKQDPASWGGGKGSGGGNTGVSGKGIHVKDSVIDGKYVKDTKY